MGVLTFFKNLFLGIMVSLYLLGSKERFAATGCKLCYTFFTEDRAAWLIRGVAQDLGAEDIAVKLL